MDGDGAAGGGERPREGGVPTVFYVRNEPVMKAAIDALERLGRLDSLTLRARGLSIPNAVAIANIITEKLMSGASRIGRVSVGSEDISAMGRSYSTIEIVLERTRGG